MKKLILLVILATNALMQAGGASLMTFAPAKAASDVFKAPAGLEAERLVQVIGGATYGCLLLTLLAMLWIWRGRRSGFDLAFAFGLMIAVIGVVMFATGTTGPGVIDTTKGLLIAVAAVWASREAPEPAMA